MNKIYDRVIFRNVHFRKKALICKCGCCSSRMRQSMERGRHARACGPVTNFIFRVIYGFGFKMLNKWMVFVGLS